MGEVFVVLGGFDFLQGAASHPFGGCEAVREYVSALV